MKKILVRLCIALVVLVVVVALGVHFFLDDAVKRGVETIGPKLTKVDVKLDGVSISLLSGSGKIKGLVIGNPDGYKTPHAIMVGTGTLELKPGSLLSDKLVIKTFNIDSPEIIFEGGLSGNNLSKILANLNDATGGSGGTNVPNATPAEQKKANKKLEVDDFTISGAKVTVNVTGLTSTPITVPIPTIHMTDLGTGPDGITVTELTKRVLSEIEKAALAAAASSATDIGKAAQNLTKGLGKDATGSLTNVTKGLGNLFKK